MSNFHRKDPQIRKAQPVECGEDDGHMVPFFCFENGGLSLQPGFKDVFALKIGHTQFSGSLRKLVGISTIYTFIFVLARWNLSLPRFFFSEAMLRHLLTQALLYTDFWVTWISWARGSDRVRDIVNKHRSHTVHFPEGRNMVINTWKSRDPWYLPKNHRNGWSLGQ